MHKKPILCRFYHRPKWESQAALLKFDKIVCSAQLSQVMGLPLFTFDLIIPKIPSNQIKPFMFGHSIPFPLACENIYFFNPRK